MIVNLFYHMKYLFILYCLLLMICGLCIGVIMHIGRNQPMFSPVSGASSAAITTQPIPNLSTPSNHPASSWSALQENLSNPLGRLLLQLIVIVVATRTIGSVFFKFGLPAVVGEIAAGILLGPSLLGWLCPSISNFIFTTASLNILGLFSQIGVTVFMFIMGMELDVSDLKEKARPAILISQIGILVPYIFGMASAVFLYPSYASAGTSFTAFALFLGIAMSITAFPVLVRILEERDMVKTPLGSAAITCAAIGDASAWAILALVIAFVRAEGMRATLFDFALLIIFVFFMLIVVRRYLPRQIGVEALAGNAPNLRAMASVLLLMIGSALATEIMGIHALFGAFLAGMIMPRQKAFRDYLAVRLENFTCVLLLPLFFAFSGLRTHIGLLNDTTSWLICLAIVIIATVGKLGSNMVAAKLNGLSWNDAFAFGALMNTRGLMELIALNIGYDLGILPPRIFTILVLMALITTFLTGPLLNLNERLKLLARTKRKPQEHSQCPNY